MPLVRRILIRIMIVSIGVILSTIAVIVLAGYALQLNDVGMAIPTAISFLLVGIALILLGVHVRFDGNEF